MRLATIFSSSSPMASSSPLSPAVLLHREEITSSDFGFDLPLLSSSPSFPLFVFTFFPPSHHRPPVLQGS
uniref:Uncharacterized protein n=1 Tax=Nelumbo nucifera TaxID=4432 RepID=A0A822ZR46_NELNU|nr:TPA_asm: hypothetical protein HUJ06_017294 [Nelumbo nucifera]